MRHYKIDFARVKQTARGYEDVLIRKILPDAKKQGHEYVALNPTRNDRTLGSFRINANTLRWSDFATGDRGCDIISLYAYVLAVSQYQAAKEILQILGRV